MTKAAMKNPFGTDAETVYYAAGQICAASLPRCTDLR
jgi:hypothetical protein